MGLNWRGATVPGAVTAIIAALSINFFVQLAGITPPWGISGPLIAFISSMILFIGISLVTRRPDLPDDIDRLLDI